MLDTTENPVNTNGYPLTFGNYHSDRTKKVNGAIDEIKFYNYALSAEEVKKSIYGD